MESFIPYLRLLSVVSYFLTWPKFFQFLFIVALFFPIQKYFISVFVDNKIDNESSRVNSTEKRNERTRTTKQRFNRSKRTNICLRLRLCVGHKSETDEFETMQRDQKVKMRNEISSWRCRQWWRQRRQRWKQSTQSFNHSAMEWVGMEKTKRCKTQKMKMNSQRMDETNESERRKQKTKEWIMWALPPTHTLTNADTQSNMPHRENGRQLKSFQRIGRCYKIISKRQQQRQLKETEFHIPQLMKAEPKAFIIK